MQAFRFIEIPKYDDGGQLMATANLCLEAVHVRQPCLQTRMWENIGHVRTRIVTDLPVNINKFLGVLFLSG